MGTSKRSELWLQNQSMWMDDGDRGGGGGGRVDTGGLTQEEAVDDDSVLP